MAKTEEITQPYKLFYETAVEWLASTIDAHSSGTVQQRGDIVLYNGWFHVNANTANGTDLFRITLPSGKWFGSMVSFAFKNPGDLQLLRSTVSGKQITFRLDQTVTSGDFINIVIIALVM